MWDKKSIVRDIVQECAILHLGLPLLIKANIEFSSHTFSFAITSSNSSCNG